MRLLNVYTLRFAEFHGKEKPPYCITSHRWSEDEATYKDVLKGRNKDSIGYKKIKHFCRRVRKWNAGKEVERVDWVWIDTCCIDKSSSAEVSESINSMWDWYKLSKYCIAYLYDVPPKPLSKRSSRFDQWLQDFKTSEWFTRGWTLQELLAPELVVFLTQDWKVVGRKVTVKPQRLGSLRYAALSSNDALNSDIAEGTGIDEAALLRPFGSFQGISDEVILSWATNRRTTRPEDSAYCMLGLFDIHMPLIYGEGERKAWRRLKEAIAKRNKDGQDEKPLQLGTFRRLQIGKPDRGSTSKLQPSIYYSCD